MGVRMTPMRVGSAAAAVIAALALATPAVAATGTTSGEGQQGQATISDARWSRVQARWQALTDEQRQCLTNAGVALPAAKPTRAEARALRGKVKAAAPGCGITRHRGQGTSSG